MNVLVIQSILPHYRIPVFNELNRQTSFQITVAHSGNSGDGTHQFQVERLPVIDFGAGHFQRRTIGLAREYDVVIARDSPRVLNSLLLAVMHSSPLILWGHGLGTSMLAPLGRTIIQWMIRRADAAIFYGQNARQYYLDQGLPSEKLFVAPNTQKVENMGFNSDAQRSSFLFVGRLRPIKRIKDLLRAFAAIRITLPSTIGVEIVGEGPQRSVLKQLSKDLGIADRVTFHGAVFDDQKLKHIFQRSLAYVSPGHVGLGVLHSFAYGVPVVTRRSYVHAPEYHNIEDGRTGFLYDGSVDSLADILQALAQEPDLSEEVGRRGFEHYRDKRQLDDMIEGFVDAIEWVTQ